MKKKITKRKIRSIYFIVIAVILLLSVYLNTYLLLKYNILPMKFLAIYFILVGLIPILLIFFTVFKSIRVGIKYLLSGIEILYLIMLFIVFCYLNQTFNFLDNFTKGYDYETKSYYVLVNKDSNYNDINDIENKTLGYFSAIDSSISKALEELNKKVKTKTIVIEGFSELTNELYNNEVDAIIMLKSYYDMFNESEDNIEDKTKILYEFSIKEKISDIGKDSNVLEDTFYIYISGVDTYGSITDRTRSDVNIVMGINPKTYEIKMVSIPRDYYVTLIPFNREDKLTHAGWYGVETSVKTIENLLDIEINYYVKVNFNAVIKLVDALGGVEVYSNYDFYSSGLNHHFKEGYNKVDGELALDFVRTRKAFLEGDRVRGENQQALIKAIIDKAASPAILTKYDDILKTLDGSFTTNIPTSSITDLLKMQLDKMPSWNLTSFNVNGTDGSSTTTYSAPGQELYVMIPDEESIKEAKEALDSIK